MRLATLKNLPDGLYERLQATAQAHRCSMNNEAIVCLEAGLLPPRPSPWERLAQLRALRVTLPSDAAFSQQTIDALKREGLP
ncbi:MAG: plasmid stability protein [Aphanocapsa feldmannii 277cV]|uniref:Plasmid stability protein n=2 Tax=Aphanocapsa feldmannii TaxID=192050 RepID=A0A524RMY0_9CHRO|nr:MAG: plasmid stability protein [Aphanocapsa feldmannii 277cV]TGH21435.1 MAG: plasmid stability protein [Aphanocapsa feldmannii 277cI]